MSTPAFRESTAALDEDVVFEIAPMSSASVVISPWKPRRDDSRATSLGDRSAGTPGSTAVTAMCPTITAFVPALTAAANGTKSLVASCSRLLPCTGSAWWLSVVTEPCPGKCLMTETIPDRW